MLLLEILRSVVDTNDYTYGYMVAPCRGLARSICQIALTSFSPILFQTKRSLACLDRYFQDDSTRIRDSWKLVSLYDLE